MPSVELKIVIESYRDRYSRYWTFSIDKVPPSNWRYWKKRYSVGIGKYVFRKYIDVAVGEHTIYVAISNPSGYERKVTVYIDGTNIGTSIVKWGVPFSGTFVVGGVKPPEKPPETPTVPPAPEPTPKPPAPTTGVKEVAIVPQSMPFVSPRAKIFVYDATFRLISTIDYVPNKPKIVRVPNIPSKEASIVFISTNSVVPIRLIIGYKGKVLSWMQFASLVPTPILITDTGIDILDITAAHSNILAGLGVIGLSSVIARRATPEVRAMMPRIPMISDLIDRVAVSVESTAAEIQRQIAKIKIPKIVL